MASYKFTLRHPDGVDIFGTEYVSNWADIATSLTEHDVYKGVLREFSNTFEFNGYIRNRIVSMLDIYGYDVAIYLSIEKGNDNNRLTNINTPLKTLTTKLKSTKKEARTDPLVQHQKDKEQSAHAPSLTDSPKNQQPNQHNPQPNTPHLS